MSTRDAERHREMDPVVGAWHGWASPVGIGLFFPLLGLTFDLVRWGLK